ncbi:glutathione S-transferase 1-like [Anthonomus grandis grandis]|uniref:glutathione S-transferase 1-like n=1 Tax=Anthonomus grandis grandis TaxID=2921223 RepID=UPI0021654E56|nr:glutathione S-transferase 1-like [Anthonomus grandis grandis]
MENEGIVPVSNGVIEFNMGSKPLDVYYFSPSPPSRAALLLIKALDLEHNIKIINIMAGDHMKPDFLKLNPLHTIPVINDNGWVLYDSTVIMKYLVDQYGKDDSLFPKDPKKGALVLQRCLFTATYLFPKFVEYHAPTLFSGATPSEKSLKVLEEVLQNLNNFLDNQMYVAGENMTIADFGTITIIATIEACGSVDITQYPNIWLWYQRCKNTMKPFGYEEVNQEGANIFGQTYKKQLAEHSK